ncbi:carboxylesterase family protein [Embleya sp. NPDC008237]|uniref:carboxylesterase family protein n=1 Tax=Embleya sp. NPDC008237 TaxID=3363978 RepID=UPI0036DFCE57
MAALAVHPEGRGLFRRAILQSPPFGVTTPDRARSLRTTDALLDVAGVADIAQLRALPWERLVEATIAMFGVQARWGRWPLPFLPLIDGSTMTRHPLAALIDGEDDPDPDILLGWTADEAGFAFGANDMYANATAEQVRARFAESFGARAGEAYRIFAAERPDADPLGLLTDLASDELFRLPGAGVGASGAVGSRASTPRAGPVAGVSGAVGSCAWAIVAGRAICALRPMIVAVEYWHAVPPWKEALDGLRAQVHGHARQGDHRP